MFSCNPAAGDVKAVLDEQAWLTDESGLETFTTFVNSHYKHLLQRYLFLHVLRCLEPFIQLEADSAEGWRLQH